MEHIATPHLVHLSAAIADRRTLRLPNPRGYRVVCLSGEAWITEEGRPGDFVLQAGESLELEGTGLALVMAFTSADLEVIGPPVVAPVLATVDFEALERCARRMRSAALAAFATGFLGRLRDLLGGRRASCARC